MFQKDSDLLVSLHDTYHVIFVDVDISVDPYLFAQTIAQTYSSGKTQIAGTLAITDEASVVSAYVSQFLNLSAPSPNSIFNAQNKYAFTQTVSRIAAHLLPPTKLIDATSQKVSLSYPIFIKPVYGVASQHAFTIASQKELHHVLSTHVYTNQTTYDWYDQFYKRESPDHFSTSVSYLAQPLITGKQYTVDGFVYQNAVTILGYTESILTPDAKSFARFDYPANLPWHQTDEIEAFLQIYVRKTHYNNAGFNLEFFITEQNEVKIIEFNTRISSQFIPLFKSQYEMSVPMMMAQLACGTYPNITKKKIFNCTSSLVYRESEDKNVLTVPTQDQIHTLYTSNPHLLHIDILVKEATKLSDYRQDSYSFRYAKVAIGADTREEILTIAKDLTPQKLGITLR